MISLPIDQLFEAALEVGAEDVSEQDDCFEVTSEPASFIEVRTLAAKVLRANVEITMIPQTRLLKGTGRKHAQANG